MLPAGAGRVRCAAARCGRGRSTLLRVVARSAVRRGGAATTSSGTRGRRRRVVVGVVVGSWLDGRGARRRTVPRGLVPGSPHRVVSAVLSDGP